MNPGALGTPIGGPQMPGGQPHPAGAPMPMAAAQVGQAAPGPGPKSPKGGQKGGGNRAAKGVGKGPPHAMPDPTQGWTRVPTVAPDFPIDLDARYQGTVSFYSKLKGYGFIEVAQKGMVPEDRLFVQWRSLKSEDRFPFLVKGMEVEFMVTKWTGMAPRGQVTLRACDVCMPGGANVHLQDELDAQKKSFLGGQELRYSGMLKFYNPRSGYGYITVDPGYAALETGEAIPTELRVERSEVNAGGQQPQFMQNVKVEFGIWKTSRDVPKAYNVTLPDGLPLTQPNLENREALNGQMYRGEVQMWNWKWGFIKAEPSVPLPPHVQEKLTKQTEDARKRAAERGKAGSEEELLYVRKDDVLPGVKLQKGSQVMFQLYLDDKGVGACQVQTI